MSIRDLAIVIVVVAAAAWLGVSAWNAWSEASEPDYEYLECVPAGEFGAFDAVTGCAEAVEVGGERYLRMTDVGEFTVWKQGRAETYRVGPAHVDLVLLTGQSNSYYCTSPQYWPDGDSYVLEHDPGASPLDPGTAFYFGVPQYSGDRAGIATRANLAECGIVDMTAPDGSVRVAATYPVFMYDWNEMTGHRVVMVNSGIGGRSIASFMPGGDCYAWTKDVMAEALDSLDPARFSVDPAGVLWSQGEADRDMPVADYERYLVRLLDYLEGGEFGISFSSMYSTLPTHFGEPGDFNSAIAQMNVASYDARFHVASTLPVELPLDGLQPYYRDQYHHYTQMVYDWMGEAFARSMAADQGYRTVPERVVYCPSATAGSATVTAYGTSGAAYSLDVEWDGDAAAIIRTPSGTVTDPRLTITAGSAPPEPPEPDTYTVSFAVASDSVGYGTVSIASLSNVVAGTSVTVGQTIVVGTAGQCTATPASSTSQYAYAFAGWTGADDSSTAIPATVTGSITLYAHFTRTVIPQPMDPSLFTFTVSGGKATVTGWAGTPPADGYDLWLPDTDGNGHALTTVAGGSSTYVSPFTGAKSLKSTTVTVVNARAFADCTLLESVDLPAAIELKASAFTGCTSLETVSLPALTTIANRAFENCTAVTWVKFGPLSTVTTAAFDTWTFYASNGTTVLSETAANLANSTFQGTYSALIKVAPGAKSSDLEKRAAELTEENAAKLKALASVDERLAELMDPSDVARMTMKEIRALTAEDVEKMTAQIEEARIEQEKMNTPPGGVPADEK